MRFWFILTHSFGAPIRSISILCNMGDLDTPLCLTPKFTFWNKRMRVLLGNHFKLECPLGSGRVFYEYNLLLKCYQRGICPNKRQEPVLATLKLLVLICL